MNLELQNITLTYPDGDTTLTAVDSVDLQVDRGQLAAVIGPSGSGKSSLLAVAGTLIQPQEGRVIIGDSDVIDLNAAERTKIRATQIGFVFQDVNLITGLTATDQLLAAVHLAGGRPSAHRDQAADLLAAVGLEDKTKRRPYQLSGGERQRVGIARALMNDPDLLLVDEPTSALDHERGSQIVQLLADLTHNRGVATVMVTHDRSQLHHVDTAFEMNDGRLNPISKIADLVGSHQ
jgi:putative ABC transport system ATP-binding protein